MEMSKGSTRRTVGADIGIFLISGLGFSQAVSANTVHVCATCAHTTIQSAVNDAASGDTVAVEAGRYVENVTVAGKALTIQGAGSSVSTVIGAGRGGPVFTLGSGAGADTNHLITIEGLTISGGHHDGGSGIGGGVQVRAGSYLHLISSSVVGNYALNGGGGIGVQMSPGAPQTTISGCIIDGNTVNLGKYGGQGGGVIVMPGSSIAIDTSFITRNQSTEGGGVLAASGTSVSITATTVSANISHGFGTRVGPSGGGAGGLEADGALSIDGSFFEDNVADTPEIFGGGIVIAFSSGVTSAKISNTIIARNTAPGGGGIAAYGGPTGTLTLDNVYIVQNNALGIYYPGVTLVQTNTTVKDNVGGNYCDNISPCTF
jgi:hypothetical protein